MNRDSSLSLLDFLVDLICPECSNINFDQKESIPDVHRISSCHCFRYHMGSLVKAGPARSQWCLSLPCAGSVLWPLPEPQWTCLGLQGSSLHAQIVFTSTQASTEWVPTSVSPCAGVGHTPRVWELTGWMVRPEDPVLWVFSRDSWGSWH